MYTTGDFIDSGKAFNADDWNPRTVRYMDYITNDLGEKQWDSIFSALSTFSRQTTKEEVIRNSKPEEEHQRVPLPPSDPPSPPHDE